MLAAMAQRAKAIKVEITSPTVALVQAVVVLALKVEIQPALEQVQEAQEKLPSLREQLWQVVAVDHFVPEVTPLEPAAQVEAAVAVLVHHLDLQNQTRLAVRNLEQQIPVAAAELAFSKVLRPMVKVRKAEQALWLFAG
jgi:hypothetical protein